MKEEKQLNKIIKAKLQIPVLIEDDTLQFIRVSNPNFACAKEHYFSRAMSKADLFGFINYFHRYIRSSFREAYENGGIFIAREVDTNPRVLGEILAYCYRDSFIFPDDKIVKKHPDFELILTYRRAELIDDFVRGKTINL